MNNKSEFKQHLEKQILSCLINDVKSIPAIANKLCKEFFTDKNRKLFELIIEHSHLIDNPDNLLIVLMREQTENVSYLLELQAQQVSFNNILSNSVLESFLDLCFSEHAEKLLNKFLKRAKSEIAGLDLLNELRLAIEQQVKQAENFKEEKPFSVKEVIDIIEREQREGDKESVCLQSIPSITSASGGFKPSNLVGIAGSFKSGKTSLSLNVIIDLVKQNIPSGFFSFELSEVEIKKKITGMLAGVLYENLRFPSRLKPEEIKSIVKANEVYKHFPLYIEPKLMTEYEIYNKTKYWRDRFGIKVVCIDYLGYIKSHKKFDTREREMSYYSTSLKQLAKELNVTVIAIAQLNRSGKTNPKVDNLAESISLARDCDFLFITYNPVDCGITTLEGIHLNESHFICKLEVTRHSKNSRKEFLLEMKDDGSMVEIATQYEKY